MNNNTIQIKINDSELKHRLDGFGEQFFKAKISALKHSAKVLKDSATDAFKSSGISNNPNPKYNDLLSDAIRISRVDEVDSAIKVHIMGVRSKGSGTFRLRFFENGTKERFQSQLKGKPLKKKRSLGQIPNGKYSFFDTSIARSESNAVSAFNETLQKYIERAWNNG